MSNYGDVLRMTGEKDGLDLEIGAALKTIGRWNGHMVRRKGDGSVYALDILISPVLDDSGYPKNFVAVERDVTEAVRLRRISAKGKKWKPWELAAGSPMISTTSSCPSDQHGGPLMHAAEGSLISRQLSWCWKRPSGPGPDQADHDFFTPPENGKKDHPGQSIFKEGLKFLRSSIPEHRNRRQPQGRRATVRGDAADPSDPDESLQQRRYAMREKASLEVSCRGRVDRKRPGLPTSRRAICQVVGAGHGPRDGAEIKGPDLRSFFTTRRPGKDGMGLPASMASSRPWRGDPRGQRVGKGTVFEIFLPRAKGRPDSKPAPPVAFPRKERILFVDDEPMQIRSVPPLLERLGYQVVGEIDARKALRSSAASPEHSTW